MKFSQARDGEVVRPNKENFYLRCCNCGVVHHMQFRVVKDVNKTHCITMPPTYHVEFRARRLTSGRK